MMEGGSQSQSESSAVVGVKEDFCRNFLGKMALFFLIFSIGTVRGLV